MNSTSFETEVATLYRLMGYDVSHRESVDGVEVDLVVKIKTGILEITAIVECSDTSRRLGAERMQRTLARLMPLISRRVDKAMIVSREGFTKAALQLAESTRIDCLSMADLRDAVVDVGRYLDHLISSFNHDELGSNYIDLHLSVHQPFAAAAHLLASQYFDEWILHGDSGIMLLLGDAGAGKTTLCRKLAHDAAQAYLADPSRMSGIPVVLPMREYARYGSLRVAITEMMTSMGGRSWSAQTLDHLIERGMLILILDDMDQVPASSWPRVRDELLQIRKQGADSRIAVSCRRAYYESEISTQPESDTFDVVLSIQPLTDSQLSEFMARMPLEETSLLRTLLESSELRELARQPLLLHMLVKVATDVDQRQLTPGRLYESFVRSALDRERQRKDRTTQPSSDMHALSAVAMQMYKRQSDVVHEADLDSRDLGETIDMLRAMPLLSRDAKGSYRFIHKSLLEFFVARQLAAEIEADRTEEFTRSILPREISQFVVSLDPARDRLRSWLHRPEIDSQVFLENVTTLLRLGDQTVAAKVPSLRIRRLRLSKIRCFDDVTLGFDDGPGDGIAMLLGDNGVGKSTILQSIALCGLGPDVASRVVRLPDRYLRDGSDQGFMTATFAVRGLGDHEETEVIVGLSVRRGSRQFELVDSGEHGSRNAQDFLRARSEVGFRGLFVAGYGAARNLDLVDEPSGSLTEDLLLDRVESLFDARKSLFDSRSLGRLVIGDGSPFREFECPPTLPPAVRAKVLQVLASLLPEQSRAAFTREGLYKSPFGAVQLSELSDGYRSTIAWVGHLLVHLLAATDWSGEIEAVSGLILIDEVDLHLHPQWQRLIIERIRKTFPNLQFIASTHSPLVVADIETDGGAAFLLEADGDGVSVNSRLPSVRGWRADQILASEIFGYLVDRDPTTERVLREASRLSGRGDERTVEENARYEAILATIEEALVPPGQTAVERDLQLRIEERIKERTQTLEDLLFGTDK